MSKASYMNELRQVRGGFIGAVETIACHDQIFLNSGGQYESTSGGFGPFEEEEGFRSGIAEALRHCDALAAFTGMVIGLVHAMPKQDAPGDEASFVLTHGGLVARNILVRDGKVVAILDWEMAELYPSTGSTPRHTFLPTTTIPGWVTASLTRFWIRILSRWAFSFTHARCSISELGPFPLSLS